MALLDGMRHHGAFGYTGKFHVRFANHVADDVALFDCFAIFMHLERNAHMWQLLLGGVLVWLLG